MKNVLVAQSGGPTAAINATLAGVAEQAAISGKVDKIYGARHGIKGVLGGQVIDIGERLASPQEMLRLISTPSSALGTCRFKLKSAQEDPESYKLIFETLSRYNIGYFVYIGGNDSMDTVNKLSAYAMEKGLDISVMGAPKTVDNDLYGMDHSPGFGSAAKYIATTFSEIWCDAKVYDYPTITIVETMGRHVGWLCAASALARKTGNAPHLIYLPEIPFEDDKFIEDVKEQASLSAAVVIAISEGIRRANGNYVGEEQAAAKVDAFGHKNMGGAVRVLESLVNHHIGCKVRCIDLSLMQRCSAHLASPIDLFESRTLGALSMRRALEGVSGEVSVINRVGDSPYRIKYSTVPASTIANREKAIPREWINARGNFVTEDVLRYIEPLIGSLDENGRTAELPGFCVL